MDGIHKRNNKKNILIVITTLVVVALVAGVVWQQAKIYSLSERVASLEKNQIPQKLFKNFDECRSQGGAFLNTFNGFDACLGGNSDTGGEIPQYQAFLQYSAQNLPRLTERKKSDVENKVTADGDYSADLIEFLKQDYTGCDSRGEYEIVSEVKDRFALAKYGCDGDGQVQSETPPTVIAIKLADGWNLISPTNHMNNGTPSCLLVDMFRISKELTPKCFENTGHDDGALRDRQYQ